MSFDSDFDLQPVRGVYERIVINAMAPAEIQSMVIDDQNDRIVLRANHLP